MEADNFPLFKYINSGRIGRINSIFHKLSIEQLLEEFTKIGGASALSALFMLRRTLINRTHKISTNETIGVNRNV